jgi:hypothetical protein
MKNLYKNIIALLTLFAFIFVLILLTGGYAKDYAERCRAVGGEPVFGQYKNVCIKPNSTLEVN